MVVILYILVSLGENWSVVAPLVQTLVFEGLPAPVLFLVVLAPSAFSLPTLSAVALPGCKHVSLNIVSFHPKYQRDEQFQGNNRGVFTKNSYVHKKKKAIYH